MSSLRVPSRSARGARVGRSGRLSSAPLRHHSRERFVTMSELTEHEFAIEMGRRLRQLRSQAGMTQIELGRRVGVHRNTIRSLEIGQGAASAWVAERCAVALAVPIRALVPRLVPRTRVVGGAAQ
jgi:DNA-binding XRE family transcriptional regulator